MPLAEQMTMHAMSNAEYATIDDINITITGYAIGTEDVSVTPAEAWNQCKIIGNIEKQTLIHRQEDDETIYSG